MGEDVDQEAGREVLLRARRRDPQRIEEAAVARVRAQLDRLQLLADARQALERVVALRVDVNDPRPLQERLVQQLLERQRLPRPERPTQQDRRRPAAARRLAQVEQHRLPRARQRVAQVCARGRADRVRGDRHQGADLLDQQVVRVVADLRGLAGEVLAEEADLLAAGPVQPHRRVLRLEPLDAALELLRRGRAHDQPDRRAQKRRAALPLQVVLEHAGRVRAARRVGTRAVVAARLLVDDVVRVHHLARDERGRLVVRDEPGRQARVDREADRLERSEQELRRRAGERDGLGQRAEREQRLVARAALRVDFEPALVDLDRRVQQAQHVRLERLERPVEQREGLGPPVAIHVRLAETAAERAADEPLKVERRRALAVEEVSDPAEGARLGLLELAETSGRQRTGIPATQRKKVARPAPRQEVVQHARAWSRQPDGHVELGPNDPPRVEAATLAAQVVAPASGVGGTRVDVDRRAGDVVVDRPPPGDPQQREVGPDRVAEARDRREQLDLLRIRQALVRLHGEPVDRPGVPLRLAEDEIAMREADRRSHRTITVEPRSALSTCGLESGSPDAWRSVNVRPRRSAAIGHAIVTRAGPRTRPRRTEHPPSSGRKTIGSTMRSRVPGRGAGRNALR